MGELTRGLQSLGLDELCAWVSAQHTAWINWAGERDARWLGLPTGNAAFPTIGTTFAHAFTPLHRYADQALSDSPTESPAGIDQDWPALTRWTEVCLKRFKSSIPSVQADPQRQIQFRTRSFGDFTLTAETALVHALTHCFWHLGGIAHLLRAAGIEPPQRSDLIFWAAAQTRLM